MVVRLCNHAGHADMYRRRLAWVVEVKLLDIALVSVVVYLLASTVTNFAARSMVRALIAFILLITLVSRGLFSLAVLRTAPGVGPDDRDEAHRGARRSRESGCREPHPTAASVDQRAPWLASGRNPPASILLPNRRLERHS